MKNVLNEFVDIEKNIRRNNLAVIGFFILCIVMVITFGVVTYKMNTYYASHRLILEPDGAVRKASMISEKDALIIQIQDFMSTFYSTYYSFNQYSIDSLVNLGLYKGDQSLRDLYNQYKNDGWYNTIIQENVTQNSTIDPKGFVINITCYPYQVSVKGAMILRKGDVTKKFYLGGSCLLESITPNFPKNPHGLFIRNWKEKKYEL
jgi:hypothetical protein